MFERLLGASMWTGAAVTAAISWNRDFLQAYRFLLGGGGDGKVFEYVTLLAVGRISACESHLACARAFTRRLSGRPRSAPRSAGVSGSEASAAD